AVVDAHFHARRPRIERIAARKRRPQSEEGRDGGPGRSLRQRFQQQLRIRVGHPLECRLGRLDHKAAPLLFGRALRGRPGPGAAAAFVGGWPSAWMRRERASVGPAGMRMSTWSGVTPATAPGGATVITFEATASAVAARVTFPSGSQAAPPSPLTSIAPPIW